MLTTKRFINRCIELAGRPPVEQSVMICHTQFLSSGLCKLIPFVLCCAWFCTPNVVPGFGGHQIFVIFRKTLPVVLPRMMMFYPFGIVCNLKSFRQGFSHFCMQGIPSCLLRRAEKTISFQFIPGSITLDTGMLGKTNFRRELIKLWC